MNTETVTTETATAIAHAKSTAAALNGLLIVRMLHRYEAKIARNEVLNAAPGKPRAEALERHIAALEREHAREVAIARAEAAAADAWMEADKLTPGWTRA